MPIAKADEAVGLEEVVEAWVKEVTTSLTCSSASCEEDSPASPDKVRTAVTEVVPHDQPSQGLSYS